MTLSRSMVRGRWGGSGLPSGPLAGQPYIPESGLIALPAWLWLRRLAYDTKPIQYASESGSLHEIRPGISVLGSAWFKGIVVFETG